MSLLLGNKVGDLLLIFLGSFFCSLSRIPVIQIPASSFESYFLYLPFCSTFLEIFSTIPLIFSIYLCFYLHNKIIANKN